MAFSTLPFLPTYPTPHYRKRKESDPEHPAVSTVLGGWRVSGHGRVDWRCFLVVCCAFSKIILAVTIRVTEWMDLLRAKR